MNKRFFWKMTENRVSIFTCAKAGLEAMVFTKFIPDGEKSELVLSLALRELKAGKRPNEIHDMLTPNT